MGDARKEVAIKVNHAQEALHGREVSGNRKGKDGLNFGS